MRIVSQYRQHRAEQRAARAQARQELGTEHDAVQIPVVDDTDDRDEDENADYWAEQEAVEEAGRQSAWTARQARALDIYQADTRENWLPEPEYYPPGHPDHVFANQAAEDAFWDWREAAEEAHATAQTEAANQARMQGPIVDSTRLITDTDTAEPESLDTALPGCDQANSQPASYFVAQTSDTDEFSTKFSGDPSVPAEWRSEFGDWTQVRGGGIHYHPNHPEYYDSDDALYAAYDAQFEAGEDAYMRDLDHVTALVEDRFRDEHHHGTDTMDGLQIWVSDEHGTERTAFIDGDDWDVNGNPVAYDPDEDAR